MTVSVIVPCFDVENYVDECIASALAQSHRDLEVVAVDDGSTDSTPERLDEWSRLDRRVRVIHQPNAGLGAARNVGVLAATGDWLFFLDGDDTLPPTALELLVESAADTGSDIACGVIEVVEGGERWRATQQRQPYDDEHTNTHLFEQPLLVHDQMVCGKLFRRGFWDDAKLHFREQVLFEDVETTTRAHCRARSIDLLPQPVYHWRRRPADDASITRQPVTARSLQHRFEALARADRLLRVAAPRSVWTEHGRKVLDVDVRQSGRAVAGLGDPELELAFVDAAAPTLRHIAPEAVARSSPFMRMLREFVVGGDAVSVFAGVRLFGRPGGRRLRPTLAAATMLVRRRPRAFGAMAGATVAARLRAATRSRA